MSDTMHEPSMDIFTDDQTVTEVHDSEGVKDASSIDPPAIALPEAITLEEHAVISTAERMGDELIADQLTSELESDASCTPEDLKDDDASHDGATTPENIKDDNIPNEDISTPEVLNGENICNDDILVAEDLKDDDTVVAGSSDLEVGLVQQVGESIAQEAAPPITIVAYTKGQAVVANLESSPRLHQHMQRYVRRSLRERRRFSARSGFSAMFLIILLLGVLSPLLFVAAYGLRVYTTYESIRTYAYSGIQHVQNAGAIFSSSRTTSVVTPTPVPTSAANRPGGAQTNVTGKMLDSTKLLHAKQELQAAHNDFVQVRMQIDQTRLLQLVVQYVPQYRPQIVSARAASQIGIDATDIGQQLIDVGLQLAPHVQGPLLSTAATPLITAHDWAMIQTTLDQIQPLANDIALQSHAISLDALPLSAHQLDQARQVLPLLPRAVLALNTAHSLMGAIGWMFGVNGPRDFLIETMDRSELRPTGGFNGQFGDLHINGGRIAPFSLENVALVEYAADTPVAGNEAPQAYRSWWPFANWGMRDANLSADYPTSARLVADQYKQELGHLVDGVIMFTPFLIEDILRATGPLTIPKYQETITAQNLEERLHYYQLDNAGIRKEEIVEHVEDPEQARKLFTSAVAHTLMDHVSHVSSSELFALGQQMLEALKTRDLQIYFANPQLENLLMRYGYAGQMDRSTTHDGLYIVQANVSASKASQYVQTQVYDTVRLDQTGGATHELQMRLVYNQLGPVYGLDTYRDYIRVYVPATARFLQGDGFDTGQPLCGGPLAACAADGIYSNDELVCPTGQYIAGASAPMLNDPYTGQFHPLDKIGPPDNLTSDEPGRAMFGGYVVIPKNCTLTVTLSWYVPPMEQGAYDLVYQRQSGTFPTVDLTVLPPADECITYATPGASFHGVLSQDMSFQLAKMQQATPATCYLHAQTQ